MAAETLKFSNTLSEAAFEADTLRDPQWLSGSKKFSYLDHAPDTSETTVWVYEIASGERKPVLIPDKSFAITGYQWSQDAAKLLFAHAPHHRDFGTGSHALVIYDVPGQAVAGRIAADTPLLNSQFSPDGRRVAYVKNNEIYVSDAGGRHTMRLTDTATKTRYNGRFGWVYEEELDLTDGWAWSPDGKYIAYYQIDETQVPQVDIPNYEDLHMKPVETHYPKAGDPNPLVKIGVIAVPDGYDAPVPATRWMDIGADTDIYICQMQWTPKGSLLIQRLNRLQNRLDILRAEVMAGSSRVIVTETDKAWIDSPGVLKFVDDTDEFLLPSDRDGNTHLYLYNLDGKLLRQVTHGAWDVEEAVGIAAEHREIFFTAARPSPLERHVFSTLLDGGADIVRLTEEPGTHTALFAPDGEYYLDTYSSHTSAPHVRLHGASGMELASIHKNTASKRGERGLPDWEFTKFTTSDGVTLDAAIKKPAHFDPNRKYPVLMFTYGGPGFQVVKDDSGLGRILENLLEQDKYIFAMVDGRGSGGRGRDFMKVVYQNLGYWEVHDQIEGAKWLGRMPFVDAGRIGIWGWSYGGYMSSLCITKGAKVFKCAAAVAPVTHWSLYDSIYTERYMRRPADNPKGYAASSPITYAGDLAGKFLLVHGLADDNVHFQNSARLAAEFQRLNKPFRMMAYPGKHHGLEGVQPHVFATLSDFFAQNL